MNQEVSIFFDALWQDYLALTPSANKIHNLIRQQDNSSEIINDHVAFRTFNIGPVSLDALTPLLESMGYTACQNYIFESKHLVAKHFEYPDNTQPKIFLSELKVEELSIEAQVIITRIVSTASLLDEIDSPRFFFSGRPWSISLHEYQTLLAESEYAAWTAAWGYHANHFTVSVNNLKQFKELASLNSSLKRAGFVLNTAGGEIKGSKIDGISQSSTMADKVPCEFSDTIHSIPSCFYEFAQRFSKHDGQLYQGFVAASADKIFESTNNTQ